MPFLEAARLYLRPLSAADADGAYPGWLNDSAVCAGNSHHVQPYSREQARAYIAHAAGSTRDLILAVVLKAGDVHIGNVSLTEIHSVYRKAEFGILLGEQRTGARVSGLRPGRCSSGTDSRR